MDNVTLDIGPEPAVSIGDRVVVIGADGEEEQTAEQLAHAIGTLSYEIVCGISARVPREYHRDGKPLE
jgi:alanine racemase